MEDKGGENDKNVCNTISYNTFSNLASIVNLCDKHEYWRITRQGGCIIDNHQNDYTRTFTKNQSRN